MTTLKRRWISCCTVLPMLGFAASAEAFVVDTSGSFANATATSAYFYQRTINQDNDPAPAVSIPVNANSTTDSVGYFGWGIDVYDSLISGDIIQSHFWFNGAGSIDGGAAASVGTGDVFSLGSFTYTNEQTVLSGGYVEVDFSMDINVDGIALSMPTYRIGIDNTVNSGANNFDTASLVSIPADQIFSSGGVNYVFEILGFSRDGGLSFETTADLAEGAQTTAEIYARISAVPLPAAFWLFGYGALGLAAIARRRR